MIVVVDASAAVEYLLQTRLGMRVASLIERADIVAPELLDVEVLAKLRGNVRLAGTLFGADAVRVGEGTTIDGAVLGRRDIRIRRDAIFNPHLFVGW